MSEIDWEALQARKASAEQRYQLFAMTNVANKHKWTAEEQRDFDIGLAKARAECLAANSAWNRAIQLEASK